MIAAVTRRRSRISVTGPRRVLSNIQKVIFHYQEAFLAFDSYCNRNIHKKERGSSADLRPPIIRTILLLSNNVVDKRLSSNFLFFSEIRQTSTSVHVHVDRGLATDSSVQVEVAKFRTLVKFHRG